MSSDQSGYAGAKSAHLPENGRKRVVIEKVTPQIEGGRFPVKRVVGETVTVQADVFSDGHDEVAAMLLQRSGEEQEWQEIPMRFIGNDRWEATFRVTELGVHCYTVRGRIDHFATWRKDLEKRAEAGQTLTVEGLIGAEVVHEAGLVATGADRELLSAAAARLGSAAGDAVLLALARDNDLARLMTRYYRESLATTYDKTLEVVVEQRGALFSAWYELFPRSCCRESGGHGTFVQCEKLLPQIAGMGFDVVYFPPVHPIGFTNRKGKNNAVIAEAEDPGSPWAIGSPEGGHKQLHPDLGSMDDFERFIKKAGESGLQVAMDIAFQCSPDHPYVRDHPAWFRWRPDGTVQYAENPPKRYEDIIPFDFETEDWQSLWEELKSVFLFWVEQGGLHLQGRQSPHKAVPPVGMAYPRGQEQTSRHHFPGRGLHSTEGDVPARQGRFQPVLHLFFMAQHQDGTGALPEGTDADRTAGIFPSQLLAQYPDILPEMLQFGGPPPSPSASFLPPPFPPATAYTGRLSTCSSPLRSRRRRSTSIRRSTKYAAGTGTTPVTCGT